MEKPLIGIRILDLTRLLPGAICTMMLADLGAEIIKVEDPNLGDYARWMPPLHNGVGAFFQASNRNKKSIIIDLKQQRGQEVFHQLVQSTDVLIEGFRPGVTNRLKCDYQTLTEINPHLIYCSLSGWGQDGKYVEKSGHDLNYVSLIGLQGAQATPQPLGGQVADVAGSYVGIMGILSALFQRERTGKGNYIDVALSESAMPFAMYAWVESFFKETKFGSGDLTGGLACYNVYMTKDGQYVSLAALEPKFWSNFCEAVQHPEWISLHLEQSQQENLIQMVSDLFGSQTADEWETKLDNVDCCFARIIPPQAIENDRHIQARNMVGKTTDGVPWDAKSDSVFRR